MTRKDHQEQEDLAANDTISEVLELLDPWNDFDPNEEPNTEYTTRDYLPDGFAAAFQCGR